MSSPPSSENRVQVPRWKVGLVALGCFVAAGVTWYRWPDQKIAFASLIRVGVLMSVIWIAMPTRDRPAAWANLNPTTVGVFCILLTAAVKPSLARLLIPIAMTVGSINYFLKPREKKRPGTRADR